MLEHSMGSIAVQLLRKSSLCLYLYLAEVLIEAATPFLDGL